MKNALRCCIACILPCGALDVIRIVHTNGRVEEITGDVTAAEIMKLHPKHVLKKPSSSRSLDDHATCPRIVVVPPEAQLQRGKIYFLIPVLPPPEKTRQKSAKKKRSSPSPEVEQKKSKQSNAANGGGVVSDQYLSEILSENLSPGQRDRRRGRVGVWRPHLESISETVSESSS